MGDGAASARALEKTVEAACKGEITDFDILTHGTRKLQERRDEVRRSIQELQAYLPDLDAALAKAPSIRAPA